MEMKPLSGRRRAYDRILRFLLYFCAALTCALLLFIIGYIFFKGLPHVTWQFLSTQPSFIKDTIGILPNILNTVYLVGVTLIITLPLGVGAAIYLTEYARNRRLVAAIEFATETLTGIPSIIFGLVGMLFFCQLLGLQASLLAGSLTLVIVTIPTIIRTTQESLKTVPQSFREAALGLGAGKWHMIRTVVLPSSVDGIVTGCILAIGRIVGESAALLFTAGMGMSLNNFFGSVGNFIHSSGASLTVALYVYARERAEFDVAFAIAAILMLLTLVINLSAKLVGRTLKKKKGALTMDEKITLSAKGLDIWYGPTQALKGVSMDIPEKQVTALIGPSGCGKSTFLKTLDRMNDLVPGIKITGSVQYRGQEIYAPNVDVTWLRKQIGMVFQKPNPFPMSIYDNVAYGPRTHGIKSKSRLDDIVEKSLQGAAIWDEVKDRLKKSALGLSGGQQQRLCIARALAVEPDILLMDEATSALDPISTSKIEDLIADLKQKYTIVIVTHNMQQATRVSDKCAFFLLGQLIEFGDTTQLFSMPRDKRTEDYITGRFG